MGGPPSPLYPPNKVVLYSAIKDSVIATLEFRSKVLGVAIRRDRLIVVLQRRVILYSLRPGPNAIQREGSYDTTDNPKGLVALATDRGASLLCILGRQKGYVSIVHLPKLGKEPLESEGLLIARNPPFPATSILLAHSSALSALSTTPSGGVIATASAQGTLIRLWDPKTSALVRELRRGTDSADILSLALRPDGGAIACASDKGTIHIWRIDNAPSKYTSSQSSAPTEGIALLKPYLPKYFSSAWSDAQFRLPPPEAPQARSLPFLDQLAEEKREKPKSVEDDKVLCVWFKVPATSQTANSSADVGSGKGKRRGKFSAPASEAASVDDDYALAIITHSGAWFKVRLTEAAVEDSKGKSRAKDPDPEREKQREHQASGFGAHGRCKLVEYKRFDVREEW